MGEAVEAARALSQSGVRTAVWNAHALKPFDTETTLRLAAECQLMVTVEDHTVIGGLGSAVAEALAGQGTHAPLMRLGIQDLFGESGEGPELYEKFGISAGRITHAIKAAIAERRGSSS